MLSNLSLKSLSTAECSCNQLLRQLFAGNYLAKTLLRSFLFEQLCCVNLMRFDFQIFIVAHMVMPLCHWSENYI